MDLSDRKNLYYLNALDLVSTSDIPYAKRVCVSRCPDASNVCNHETLPCTSNAQYQ